MSLSQMRKIYIDNQQDDNEIRKISFFSASEGYVAFDKWVGYTADTGRSFEKKFVTANNVDYRGNNVNLTFGFAIAGVKAFNKNNIIVYGHYGYVPSILVSSNGGNTFALVFHSSYDMLELKSGIMDMIFPENGPVGYAVDADRVIKTSDQGLTWGIAYTYVNSNFSNLEATDNNNVTAFSKDNPVAVKTNNGSSWTQMLLPAPSAQIQYLSFLSSQDGWLALSIGSEGYIYKTTNGGNTWALLNDARATPFSCKKIKFFSQQNGYALGWANTVYKTTDGGVLWEPLPRDNNYSFLGYEHNDMQCYTESQLWAGGGHGFLELSTNSGGTPLPRALFRIDTAGYSNTGKVGLLNYSKPGYSFKWYVNKTLAGTTYSPSYPHNPDVLQDTVMLVVNNGITSDTAVKYQAFYPAVTVTSFSPLSAGVGKTVTITGTNFTDVIKVSFGGTAASNYTVQSQTSVIATVGGGQSGKVEVQTATGKGALAGFVFVSPPVLASFSPVSATAGSIVTVTGNNFIDVISVRVGGVSADFTTVSSTVMTVVVPSTTSGEIEVTTPGGTATLGGFTAMPVFSSFSPRAGGYGTELAITGTSLGSVTGIKVGATNVLSFFLKSPSSITAVVGGGSSGNVTLESSGGVLSQPSFTWYAPPVISGFSPLSGPVGTAVTISGTGFHPTASMNSVYFGGVKAKVTGGSQGKLNVEVPAGASYMPLSVSNTNLAAYSSRPFSVTFANGGNITDSSFTRRKIMKLKMFENPTAIISGDLDGDGKNDLVVSHRKIFWYPPVGIALYRNVGDSSDILFDTAVWIRRDAPGRCELVDLDRDGKLDIIVHSDVNNFFAPYLLVFINKSIPGKLRFDEQPPIATSSEYPSYTVGDLDVDGRPDVIFSASGGNTQGDLDPIYFCRNTSEPGSISFTAPVKVAESNKILQGSITAADLDDDRRIDILLPGGVVLKNNSSPGNIALDVLECFTGYDNSAFSVADIDGDGMSDIVSANRGVGNVAVMRNSSTGGILSFDAPLEYDVEPTQLAIGDLDGDGRPDMTVSPYQKSYSLFKNTSTPGNISFGLPVSRADSNYALYSDIDLTDINGDGRGEITTYSDSTIEFYNNNVAPEPFIQKFSPTYGGSGTVVQIEGGNLGGATNISFGGVPAGSFTVNSQNNITAVVGAGSSGEVKVTTAKGTASKDGYVFDMAPEITSLSSDFGKAGTNIQIKGTGFGPGPADNVVFFGDVNAVVTAASPLSISAVVPKAAAYKPVTVTSRNLTAFSPSRFSLLSAGGPVSFTPTSFANVPLRSGLVFGNMCDMDGDGMLDMLGIGSGGAVGVARNLGSAAGFSFSTPSLFSTPETQASRVFSGDLDGDGKKDVIALTIYNTITVFRNTGSEGNIGLDPVGTVATTPAVSGVSPDVKIYDLDGDGKPEIILCNYASRNIYVYRNISKDGKIAMSQPTKYSLPFNPYTFTVNDLGGDGKADIIVCGSGEIAVSVFTNLSVPGDISLRLRQDLSVGTAEATGLEVFDIDNDGKNDMVVTDASQWGVRIFRSQGFTDNKYHFEEGIYLPTGIPPRHCNAGDLDGDGKPDLTVMLDYNDVGFNLVANSFFKNNSIPGKLVVQKGIEYYVSNVGGAYKDYIADIDGDGLPDVASFLYTDEVVLLKNMLGSVNSVEYCPGNTLTLTSNLSGAVYRWQQLQTVDGIYAEIIDGDGIFTGANTPSLQFIGDQAAPAGTTFRCLVDGNTSKLYVIKSTNMWLGTQDSQWENPLNWSCGVVPGTDTDVIINGGKIVLSSNTSIKSLRLSQGANFSVQPGSTLEILSNN